MSRALSPTRGFWPPDAPGSAAFVPGSLTTLRVRGAPKTHAYWVACLPPPGLLTSESVPISICTNLCSIGIGGRGGPPPSLGARDGSRCLRPATPPGGRPQPPGGTAFPRFCLRTDVRGAGRKTHERERQNYRRGRPSPKPSLGLVTSRRKPGSGPESRRARCRAARPGARVAAVASGRAPLGWWFRSDGRDTPGGLITRHLEKIAVSRIRAGY